MRGRRWSMNEIWKVLQLQAMGYSNTEICKQVGRTYGAVSQVIYAVHKGDYKFEW